VYDRNSVFEFDKGTSRGQETIVSVFSARAAFYTPLSIVHPALLSISSNLRLGIALESTVAAELRHA